MPQVFLTDTRRKNMAFFNKIFDYLIGFSEEVCLTKSLHDYFHDRWFPCAMSMDARKLHPDSGKQIKSK
jgi:hypothetical protein